MASSRKLSLSRAAQPPEYATVDAASAASTAVLGLAALVRRCRASRVGLFGVSLSADEVHISFGPSPLQTPLATVQDCAVVRCFTTYHSSGCFNCDSSQRRKNQNSHRFTVTNPVINIRKKNDRSLVAREDSKKGESVRVCKDGYTTHCFGPPSVMSSGPVAA